MDSARFWYLHLEQILGPGKPLRVAMERGVVWREDGFAWEDRPAASESWARRGTARAATTTETAEQATHTE